MAKFVCCGLILEATIFKKETKFATKALNLSYQKRCVFMVYFCDVLMARDNRGE